MAHPEIAQILEDTDRSLIEVYLDLQVAFESKYGKDTVVVMEVGSFFEVYGVDNDKETIGKPKEIGDILNLQLTRKNKSIAENSAKNPLLVGFPAATFDRYMGKLVQEQKYTIVIVRQKGVPPKITRHVDRILSPGVNADYSLDHDDNFVASLVIDKQGELYSAGYAAIDVTTGKSYLLEVHSTKEDPTFALDELFRLLQSHRTAEIVLTLASGSIDITEIKNYLELFDSVSVKQNDKRLKVSYQNELFKQTYIINSFLSPIEFLDLERKPLTSEALALLIEFIVAHDYDVIARLSRPVLLENNTFLYLGNNPLEQLGITSKDPDEFTLIKMMDKTVTSIGRRLLRERLMNPVVHPQILEERYNLSDALSPITSQIDGELRNVYDLERINRRITIGRLHPFEVNFLYDSLVAARAISEQLAETAGAQLLPELVSQNTSLDTLIAKVETTFDLDETTKYAQKDIKESFFVRGFDAELDDLLERIETQHGKLSTIRDAVIKLIETKTDRIADDFVQIKQLDKEGHYLHLTKSRYFLIEQELKDQYVSIDGTVYACSDFTCKVQTTNVKITAPIIDTISEEIVVLQTRVSALVKELFAKELQRLDADASTIIETTSSALAKIDVALSNGKCAVAYNLVRPDIVEQETSMLDIADLRHPLVEHRELGGMYIPNDVVLDNDTRGILLYGINSSGKSSLMKSLGITVVLAQSGCYVPARNMRFTLVHELFTRIVSQDNIDKGLSSFAVEMMELKNIFNRCSDRSLILGDEISHGTETLSAIAIVSAALKHLHKSGAHFLFTTHLHQLQQLPYLQELSAVASKHLSVRYDKDNDVLLFDRKLQDGSGSSIYGLEFAQSLHMNEQFLRDALTIRKELAGELDDLELLTKKKQSKYNKDLYLTSCGVCGGSVEDTHHIHEQHTANEHGHIDHFHKDHKYNLLPLCGTCHDRVHAGSLQIKGFVMTSKGVKLEIEEE